MKKIIGIVILAFCVSSCFKSSNEMFLEDVEKYLNWYEERTEQLIDGGVTVDGIQKLRYDEHQMYSNLELVLDSLIEKSKAEGKDLRLDEDFMDGLKDLNKRKIKIDRKVKEELEELYKSNDAAAN